MITVSAFRLPVVVPVAILAAALVIGVLPRGATRAAPAQIIVVVNTLSDSVHVNPCGIQPADCSLRDAIKLANGFTGASIRFSSVFAGAGMNVITLSAALGPLPPITATGAWLDGGDPGGNPVNIFLDGRNLVTSTLHVDGIGIKVSRLNFGNGSTTEGDIFIEGGRQIEIAYNTIGANFAFNGNCAAHVRNGHNGILMNSGLGGNASAGGGSAYIYGNTIGCHAFAGIFIPTPYVYVGERPDGAADANYIGADLAGHALPNIIGVSVVGASTFVRNNRIVSNGLAGVHLNSGASLNVVQTNTIRLNGNAGIIVDSGAHDNLVGSPLGGPLALGNVIGANAASGVYLGGAATAHNALYGNLIGIDASGMAADANGVVGVAIDNGANANYVGAQATERNVIAGNGADGITLMNGAHHNLVQANLIGVRADGSAILANAHNGVSLFSGAHDNTIGGPLLSNGNTIGGSGAYGVLIDGSSTATNTLSWNSIGRHALTAAPLPNQFDGIALLSQAHDNIIGGPSSPNQLASNGWNGIELSAAAQRNLVAYNDVGFNAKKGVLIDGAGTVSNTLDGVWVHHNGEDGISERNGAANNVWTRLRVDVNHGLGVDRFADFGEFTDIIDTPFPTITQFVPGPVTWTVSGVASPSDLATFHFTTTVELYLRSTNPLGYGDGHAYLASTTTDAAGNWSMTIPVPAYPCFVALETQRSTFPTPAVYSSEFGPATSCNVQLFLPVMVR